MTIRGLKPIPQWLVLEVAILVLGILITICVFWVLSLLNCSEQSFEYYWTSTCIIKYVETP